MAPTRPGKRKSNPSHEFTSPSTPQRSPIKKRKIGLTQAQKQTLIDNLQLEITERARRLRAQYHVQAQQLRSRVEMRINRIPTNLRKAKMGELLSKSLQPQEPRRPRSPITTRGPPVPLKDGAAPKPIARKPVAAATTRGTKRLSEEPAGNDKENRGESTDSPKKKMRGGPAHDKAPVQPGQILSPTSSNARIVPGRERPPSPAKSMIARPASPMKGPSTKTSSSNLLSNMVEKAKGTRGTAAARKVTTSSTASSNAGPATATAARGTRKAAAPPSTASTAATRGRRKVSGNSEAASEASTATVVKKTTASRATKTTTAAAQKKTVMGSIRSAAATRKAPAAKPAAAAAPAPTGRTLRKRG